MTAGSRQALVVVANRLPVERAPDPQDGWVRAPGGLVSALTPIVRDSQGMWIGWDGGVDASVERFTDGGIDLVPIALSAEEIAAFYDGFANETLWPLFHDVIVKPQFRRETWAAYRAVNRRYADLVVREAAASATVWVHDYQLTLVPALVRARRPDLTIGFFNHIPFPPQELFAQLPWGSEVLAGLMGADLVGFQRPSDVSNFLAACRHAHGVEPSDEGFDWRDRDGRHRRVVARHYPIGVDVESVLEHCRGRAARRLAREFREQLGDRTILLGVDRLDYTKGIMVRLQAVAELLDTGDVDPNEVVYVQVSTPSRERVDAYQSLRDEIELAVGRINGAYSTLSTSPVVYLRSTVPIDELVALYRLADVMLVTSLRDGMNLVAKEYVTARTDDTGALVLSEFTGAADDLPQALLINPHDIDGVKAAILHGVRMPVAEQRERMAAMRHQVLNNDVRAWAARFLTDLRSSGSRPRRIAAATRHTSEEVPPGLAALAESKSA